MFQEAFDERFHCSIPQVNSTRWNSLYMQVEKIAKLPLNDLNALLDTTDHKNLKITLKERELLVELVDLLKPFYEITQTVQGEKASGFSNYTLYYRI